ncbi:MAG TPA: alpha/beta hydrolase [Polyangiales bacterium]|nr:alpha/beta hydrolase [Polyangiales bacterium]
MPREIVLTSVPDNDSTAHVVPPVVTGEIELPTGHFAYLEQGHADAPLILLAHGFPDHPKTFLPLMALLCAAGYRCVAPWLRGYAPSTLEGPYDRQRVGDDLAELAEALCPNAPAVLVGHDWGAAATYTAVGRWPQRFRSAVTLAVPHVAAFERNLRKSRSQQQRSLYMALCMLPGVPERVLRYADFAYIEKLWRRWSPNYRANPDYMRELKSCLRASMPAPLGYYRALRPSRMSLRQSLLDARIRIYVPLLHLHGADDGCIEFAMSEGEHRYFEGEFRSRELPGLGHFLQLEDPRQIADAILEFIEPQRQRRSEVEDVLRGVDSRRGRSR